MPEEFEGAMDSGMQDGDTGGPEPTGGGAGAPTDTPAQPSYMTREMFDEAMSGYSASQQERIDRVAQSFSGMQDMIREMVEAQKPKPPPLVPDAKDLESIDARGMQQLLSSINQKHETTLAELRKELQSTRDDWKRQTEASRIHGYLKEQISKTASQHQMLQTPYGQQLLENLVIATLQNSGNDLRKVNVPGLAQAMHSFLDSEVKSRMAAAAKAAQAGQAGATGGGQAAGKAPPPKGAATKPGETPGSGINGKNFAAKMREMIANNFPAAD